MGFSFSFFLCPLTRTDIGSLRKLSLPLGWRYCLSWCTPRAISIPDLLIVSFFSLSLSPFLSKTFLPISIPKNFGQTCIGKFLPKLLGQKKFESVRLDTFTIPIPPPAGGSHLVFDSETTLSPWDDPLPLKKNSGKAPKVIRRKNSWSAFPLVGDSVTGPFPF